MLCGGRGGFGDLGCGGFLAFDDDGGQQKREERKSYGDVKADPKTVHRGRCHRFGVGPTASVLQVPTRARRGHAAENRQTERTAKLLRGIEQPGREPGQITGHTGSSGNRHADKRKAEPQRHHGKPGQKITRVMPVHRHLRQE